MKIVEHVTLLDYNGYSNTEDFRVSLGEINSAVSAVVNPPGHGEFAINPTKHGNGVKPIKEGFVTFLIERGWRPEVRFRGNGYNPGAFDVHRESVTGKLLPIAVEWETGNISSSHRALNRLALGILREEISAGFLVLPSKNLYPYLTDRVGNSHELTPYHELWKRWDNLSDAPYYLGLIVIEHDKEDASVPCIAKGTDGRALR